jgi:hypothetical protein
VLKPTRCWLQSPILSARAGVNHIFIWIITHPSHSTKHWFLRWWFQLEQWSHLSSWNVPNHWIWFSPWIQTKLIWIWYWIDTFNIFIHPQWCYVQGKGVVLYVFPVLHVPLRRITGWRDESDHCSSLYWSEAIGRLQDTELSWAALRSLWKGC